GPAAAPAAAGTGTLRTGTSLSPATSPKGVNPGDVVSNVAEFGENLVSLVELQARLVRVELKQNFKATQTRVTVVLAGLLLAFASVPIGLVGIAELLVSELDMKRGYAFLSVTVAALVMAGLLIVLAGLWVRSKFVGFPLSGEELARN